MNKGGGGLSCARAGAAGGVTPGAVAWRHRQGQVTEAEGFGQRDEARLARRGFRSLHAGSVAQGRQLRQEYEIRHF